MRITIFGSGYVGLVAGVCLAEMGNQITLLDVDAGKIERLKAGEVPIYEPGLEPLLHDNLKAGRISFTTDPAEAVPGAEACFVCVGTPMGADGHADLRFVESVARTIGEHMDGFTVVVDKSTVPVGTADKVRGWIGESLSKRDVDLEYAVASNPEFLKEGAAVEDFLRPDRVIIGTDDPRASRVLREIYSVFMRNGLRFYDMDVRSAEMTKYTANCMLATKISFINEVANLCDRVGADVELVRQGVGSDSRIGMSFLHPGAGYGGSCFPKDVREMIATSHDAGYTPRILEAVDAVNRDQKRYLQAKIEAWCTLTDRTPADLTVAVWGLAFKPQTDDVREAPALDLARWLLECGATIRAHDPHAMHTFQAALGKHAGITYQDDPYASCDGADILAVVTEWRPFRRPDARRLAELLSAKVVFDGRNLYDAARWRDYGLTVFGVGTGHQIAG